MSHTHTDIQASFSATIANSQLPDALIDVGETTIDGLLENPLVQQLPIVKTIAGLLQVGMNIHDRLFLKKILALLQGIDDIPEAERQKIIAEVDSSGDYQIKVGEKLLYIIDTCDDHTNAQNVSKLFAAMLKKQITYSQFMQAAQIIARISSSEIQQFIDAYRYRYIDGSAANLSHTGLTYSKTSEVEVEVDLKKVEQEDWDDSPEHYEADTNTTGGETVLYPTPSGEVIFDIFGIGRVALKKQWESERKRQVEELRRKYEGKQK